jgi:hypothetical protein
MTIPKSIVLDSDFSLPDWDAQLASKLWAECKKESSSLISGYVNLLTKSQWTISDLPSIPIPPSTAPDALRHWTEDQLMLLEGSPAGEKLLGLMQKQEQIWKSKFANVNSDMSWEQFQWGKMFWISTVISLSVSYPEPLFDVFVSSDGSGSFTCVLW